MYPRSCPHSHGHRYFRLSGSGLKSYPDDKASSKMKKDFALKAGPSEKLIGTFTLGKKMKAPPTNFTMVLRLGGRDLSLCFDNQSDLEEWTAAIRGAVGLPDPKKIAAEKAKADAEAAAKEAAAGAGAEADAGAGDDDSRIAAATKIQAKTRQRQALAKVEELKKKRKEELVQFARRDAAATKIQLQVRSRMARKRVEALKVARKAEAERLRAAGDAEAAAKVEAELKEEETAAEAQLGVLGAMSSAAADAAHEERVEAKAKYDEEEAAVMLQAIARGKLARRDMEALKTAVAEAEASPDDIKADVPPPKSGGCCVVM